MQDTIPTDRPQLPADPQQMLVSVSDQQVHRNNVMQWAKVMYESGSFSVRNIAAAAVKIQAGYELGFGVVASLRNIHVFDNNVSVAAIGMAMKINQSPNYDYEIITSTDDECIIDFWGISKRTKQWKKLGTESFTKADVATAKLTGKDNHAKYPKAMKFARAMSAGCRKYCAEVFSGAVYSPEEAADFSGATVELDAEGNVLNVTPPGGNANAANGGRTNNVTPIDGARSNKAASASSGQSRTELFAQIRAIFGIEKSSLTKSQAESILADMSITLGNTFKTIADISDEAALAYINRKNAQLRDAQKQPPTDDELAQPTPQFVPMSQKTNAKLFLLLSAVGITDKPARLAFANYYDVAITSFTELSEDTARYLITRLEELQASGNYSKTNPWSWARAVGKPEPSNDDGEDEEAMYAAAHDPANEIRHCNACGVQTHPIALAQAHAADCELDLIDN